MAKPTPKPKPDASAKPKKKITKKPTPKQIAKEKYQKRLDEFKVLVSLQKLNETRVERPALNTIGEPSGIQKLKGKKRGKKFVHEDSVTHLLSQTNCRIRYLLLWRK
jgi:hypothetical protein